MLDRRLDVPSVEVMDNIKIHTIPVDYGQTDMVVGVEYLAIDKGSYYRIFPEDSNMPKEYITVVEIDADN